MTSPVLYFSALPLLDLVTSAESLRAFSREFGRLTLTNDLMKWEKRVVG